MSQPPIANDPWAPIIEALDNDAVTDLALIVGNAAGEQFRYQKGSFDVTASYNIASASKWLTSATILTLVEQGIMDLADQPQDYLTYWTDEPSDPRSAITLAQLLSFTAGFQRSPIEGGCIGEETVSLADCVAEWYAIGVDATPGTTFHYGPVHMQVAAAMAEVATGQSWGEIVAQTLAAPLGANSLVFDGNNPRASGGATANAIDYALFLEAQLTGALLPLTFTELATERTTLLTLSSRPAAVTANNVDWHYGLGVWRECPELVWDASCTVRTLVSSPGAFGWYPWIDADEGYYAVLAMEEPITLTSSPSEDAVKLGAQLQPLITDALRN
ncbi:MAG: serine hydrolase domain-containing protein [Woeseiaceae bacterium]